MCGQDTVTGVGAEGGEASSHPEGHEKKSEMFSRNSEKPLAHFKAGMMSSDLHFEKIPMIQK